MKNALIPLGQEDLEYENYSGKFSRDSLTIEESLRDSVNSVAVDALQKLL